MKLICGVTYDVAVIMPSGKIMTTPMQYCGGSWVEKDGSHIAFGIWAKGNYPRRKQFGKKRNHNNFIPVPGTGRTEQNKYDDEGTRRIY